MTLLGEHRSIARYFGYDGVEFVIDFVSSGITKLMARFLFGPSLIHITQQYVSLGGSQNAIWKTRVSASRLGS